MHSVTGMESVEPDNHRDVMQKPLETKGSANSLSVRSQHISLSLCYN